MAREILKAARKGKGMTQQQVADYLGIKIGYYKQLEAGKRTGNVELWDSLEDLLTVHQRVLREISDSPQCQVDSQQKLLV